MKERMEIRADLLLFVLQFEPLEDWERMDVVVEHFRLCLELLQLERNSF